MREACLRRERFCAYNFEYMDEAVPLASAFPFRRSCDTCSYSKHTACSGPPGPCATCRSEGLHCVFQLDKRRRLKPPAEPTQAKSIDSTNPEPRAGDGVLDCGARRRRNGTAGSSGASSLATPSPPHTGLAASSSAPPETNRMRPPGLFALPEGTLAAVPLPPPDALNALLRTAIGPLYHGLGILVRSEFVMELQSGLVPDV